MLTFLECSLLSSLGVCSPSAYIFKSNEMLHMHCKRRMELLIAL